jgi:hypothetical protein
MSVASIAVPTQYVGNGITTTFAFPYKFLSGAHLTVVLTDSAGNDTPQTPNTHYSVAGAGLDAGGTVTFVTAPAAGVTVTIYRETTKDQQTDYVSQDNFPAESHESALD